MLYKKGSGQEDLTNMPADASSANNIIALFNSQYNNNPVYKAFTDALGIKPGNVHTITGIPFLPISFFKSHVIISGTNTNAQLLFESSGTTGTVNSKHYVVNEAVYRQSLLSGFRQFYGNVQDYTILALLPSYLERQNASLVHMAKVLMEESKQPGNGFYLDEWDKLHDTILQLETDGKKTLLLGVTFALLDFATNYPMQLQHTIVMETGGMKGRHEEWTRAQVHDFLKEKWGLPTIHSEYGMTELLSQAYSMGNGLFQPSATMRVLVRDINDPLDIKEEGTGCLNIIDTANIYSCAFIATDDIGTVYADGSFEVLGRADHTALRGCSLMVV